MPDFITLSCPSCGGQLQITNDIERFACAHCGMEHIVKRGSGIVSLSPVVDSIRKVQTGVDKTASELAIVRLRGEIAEIEKTIQSISESKNTSTDTKNKTSVRIILIGIIMFLCGLSQFITGINDKSNLNETCLFIPLCLGILFFVFGINQFKNLSIKEREFDKKKESDLETWINLLNQKKAELKHHQDVVGKLT